MSKHIPTNILASYLILKKDNKVLLAQRLNTGYRDGEYSLVAGHVDDGESFTAALLRESKEEIGLSIDTKDIKVVHILHRKSVTDGSQRVDCFYLLDNFTGQVRNLEPHKCSKLTWFSLDSLPENTVPYIKFVFDQINQNIKYSEYGWE